MAGVAHAAEPMPAAAIVGMGLLGSRIAAELLLLGADVTVYDRTLCDQASSFEAAQRAAREKVRAVFDECAEAGLLALALQPDPSALVADHMRVCSSVADAVAHVDAVLDCVPDTLELKGLVLSECLQHAPSSAIVATSTLNLPLAQIHVQVQQKLGNSAESTRVIGLRFLWPVVFVPFLEITLTAAQNSGTPRNQVLNLLSRWHKAAFACDVQGSSNDTIRSSTQQQQQQRRRRLVLEPATATARQRAEAQLRGAHRSGPDQVARLNPRALWFAPARRTTAASSADEEGGDCCCVCFENPPTVRSVLCGHCVVCAPCGNMLLEHTRKCPMCRAPFLPEMFQNKATS